MHFYFVSLWLHLLITTINTSINTSINTATGYSGSPGAEVGAYSLRCFLGHMLFKWCQEMLTLWILRIRKIVTFNIFEILISFQKWNVNEKLSLSSFCFVFSKAKMVTMKICSLTVPSPLCWTRRVLAIWRKVCHLHQ